MKNDIALLKLASPALTSRNNIETICLPLKADNDIDKIFRKLKKPPAMTISGFGRLGSENREQPDVLQKAFVPYVNHSECQRKYGEYRIEIDIGQFCAGGRNATDTCKGDSGGSITSINYSSDSRQFIFGVVSSGVTCDNSNKLILPGIYTDIRYYMHWMLDSIE